MKLFSKSLLLLSLMATLLNLNLYAEQNCFDPYARNLIYISADAKEIIPVDSFEIVFGFDVNTDFFANSAEESKRIIKAIENNIKNLGLNNVEIIKGWDFIRQSKISIGDKGRKISNNLTIRVKDFPKDKLHSLISQIIDLSLGVDKVVVLESLSAFVSEEIILVKEEEIYKKALSNLKEKAESEAAILGKSTAEPKRIYRVNEPAAPGGEYGKREAVLSYSETKLKKSFISIQKPFNINAEIVDRVEIKASVSGVYEIK